ncbi:hypothetical protein [Rhodopseudomonas palustris]|uniref:hypothetical protein n=1 Tax=Rhodopseudomonas palustris TaxID=1076 RepID=UPI000D217C8A|nr:hypothetical protein [Rhodopseudomonas palustris]AVT80964.1 hypothetical protein RPYSC3_21030 [Rhodopseudomonas palustris]
MTSASLQMTPSESRRLARLLGWVSLGLGAAEVLAPHRLARALGMEGNEHLLQLYGAREIASGVAILTTESAASVWSRVGGDALDVGTLALQLRRDNPKRGNVALALAAVGGITMLDWACAQALTDDARRRNRHASEAA